MRSLTTRLTMLVLVLLCICGTLAGFAFHRSLRRALESELQRRLAVRIAWLAAATSVDRVEGGKIKLHKRPHPDDAARWWQVATTDGKVLWASHEAGEEMPAGMVRGDRILTYGDPALPVTPGREIVPREELTWKGVPAAVRAAAERAVPELVPERVERRADAKTQPAVAVYTIEGGNIYRDYALTITAEGRLLRFEPGRENDMESTSILPRYQLTGKPGRIVLRLSAWTSAARVEHELARMSWVLETVGPLALLVTALVLAVSIRWQLRPLSRMAEQAGRIGPGSCAERIGPVGSTAECSQLREAINGMLDRLAEGIAREHRFAATAAHELRTPLAQLRTTIEVALRRERGAAEYRAALVDTLADVERLQKLVLGLLHLSRSADPAAMADGHPVRLPALLTKACRDHGPATVVSGTAGNDVAVLGDEDLFVAALGNVLENAAHYAPGAPATIQVEEAADSVRLCVADRGPGIAEADRERIFEPLTRLATNGTPPTARAPAHTNGFGLGLTVARAAARAYGGDLTCRGRADGAPGAEFVFSFRKADPSPEE